MRLATYAALLAGVAFLAFHPVSVAATDGDALFEEDSTDELAPSASPLPVAVFGNESHPLIELNANDFNVTVGNHSAILVEFYAPWCNVCKGVKKEYERAARLAWDLKLPASVARLDVNKPENVEFAKETMGIVNLPTFVLFKGSVEAMTEFPVLTTGEAYVAGLGKMVGSELDLTPAKVLDDDSAIDVASWIFWRGTSDGKLQSTLMFYDPPREGMTPEASAAADLAFKAFDVTAKELMRFSNLRFAICRKREVLEEFEIPLDRHSLVLYKEHDEGRVEYTGDLNDATALQKWVVIEDTPLVTDVWHKTLQAFRKRVQTLVLFFISGDQFEHYPTQMRVKEGLQEVAFALLEKGLIKKGEFTIAVADGTKYKSWMSNFGLPTNKFPAAGAEYTPTQRMRALEDFSLEASLLDNPFDRLLEHNKTAAAATSTTSGSSNSEGEAAETEAGSEADAEAEAAAYALRELEFEARIHSLSPEAAKHREEKMKAAAAKAKAEDDAVAAVAVDANGEVAAAASAAPAASAAASADASGLPSTVDHTAQTEESSKVPWVKVPVDTLLGAFEGYFHFLNKDLADIDINSNKGGL